jgi:small neutral amino acid transporter SnatA (MarC family)
MNAVSLKEMRRQPRIACAVSWVPLAIPLAAGQRPVSVISSSNTARVSSGICWSAADMRLVAQ